MKKFILSHKKEIGLGLVVFLQFLAIAIYNFKFLRLQVDFDSSSGFMQLVEIWKQKTFLIEDWEYQTTLGWDIPMSLAVFFYAVTKNVFFSMGLANVIITLCMIVVIYDILRECKITVANRLFCLMIFLMPYSRGQLGYAPMLFTGTASYSFKILIPLLLLDAYLRFRDNKKRKLSFVIAGLGIALSFLTGLSSGVYVLLCGVLPLIISFVVTLVIRRDYKGLLEKRKIIIYAALFCGMIGFVINSSLNLVSHTNTMNFLTADKVCSNLGNCIVAIWELFGGFARGREVPIISLEGIVQLCGWFIGSFIIFVIIFYFIKVLRGRENREIIHGIVGIQFVNFMVFVLADLSYTENQFEARYHIIPIVLGMLLVPFFFKDMEERISKSFRNALILVLTFALICSGVFGFKAYYQETLINQRTEALTEITEYAKKNDIKMVYAMASGNTLGDGRIMRVCDLDLPVCTISTLNEIIAWGASTRYFENGSCKGKTMLMLPEEEKDNIPVYLRKQYTYQTTMCGHLIYVSKRNPIDCISGLNKNIRRVVDFPYSPGYIIGGELQEDGSLHVSGEAGIKLYGPDIQPIGGNYIVTLKLAEEVAADKGKTVGKFGMYDSQGNLWYETEIKGGTKKAVLYNARMKSTDDKFHFVVTTEEGIEMYIDSIVTKRIEDKENP